MLRKRPEITSRNNGRAALAGLLLLLSLFLIGCQNEPGQGQDRQPVEVTVEVDGKTRSLSSRATNVRQVLEEANITLSHSDEVEPPLFTPLTESEITIKVIRVTETVELIERPISFDRRFVRNEAMSANDPPVIIQAGRAGALEVTVRVVQRDGIEAERRETQAIVIAEPQDEIIMVGLGAAPGNVSFAGRLAYINGGNSIILRSATAFPETLNTGLNLDRRVFSLSPTGEHLLYTRATTETERFNSLWLISTGRGAEPVPLNVDNVLWAGWNPAVPMQIAYTTAVATELLPGWEANNDLWLAEIDLDGDEPELELENLVETYPATHGWWGGNYAWSPDGRYIAYSFANEVGAIDIQSDDDDEDDSRRIRLHQFMEYNTRADWVWVPTLSWSPDGRYLVFTHHSGDDPEALLFDSWALSVPAGAGGRFAGQTGIWSHPYWSPAAQPTGESQIAFLRATNPLDSLRSTYTLWLMDSDGSNAHQIYPPAGENSRFPRERQFLAWGPTGRDIAFIFNEDLYLLNLDSRETYRVTEDDNVVTHPTWAPYGYGIEDELPSTERAPLPAATEEEGRQLLPDEP